MLRARFRHADEVGVVRNVGNDARPGRLQLRSEGVVERSARLDHVAARITLGPEMGRNREAGGDRGIDERVAQQDGAVVAHQFRDWPRGVAQAVGVSGGPIYATVAAPDATKIPSAQTFVSDYKTRFGSDVGPYSATAYDAMNILIQAVKTALSTEHTPKDSSDSAQAMKFRQAVIDALKQTSYDGVTGHTGFDQNGDTTNKIFTIYQVASVSGKPDWKAVSVVTVQ